MTTKQERLCEVYDYLRAKKGIHTQVGFAEALHITRPAISAAMNGNESYLTKNLFQKICGAFPGIFNLDYLLTGQGELLLASDDPSEPAPNIKQKTAPLDKDFYRIALENNASVIASMRKDIEYYQQLVLDKDGLIQEYNEQIIALQIANTRLTTELDHTKVTLNAVRKNFDAKVDELAQRDRLIAMLQGVIKSGKSSGINPHIPGVADGDSHSLYATDDPIVSPNK
jgi:transcriptional regulator with XRE-family HTH domain